MKIVLTVAALAALAALAAMTASGAHAATVSVDTYNFTEGGFAGQISPGSNGVLSGTFTGVVEANGTIGLADLRSITVKYTVGAASLFGYGPASFFSFIPGSDSTLDVETGIGVGQVACVGAVAAFGFGRCGAGGVNGEVAGLDTTQGLPVLTLVSSGLEVTVPIAPQPVPGPGPMPIPPQPQPLPVTAVPAPGWQALGAAALALGGIAARRRAA